MKTLLNKYKTKLIKPLLLLVVLFLSISAFSQLSATIQADTACSDTTQQITITGSGGALDYTYDVYEWTPPFLTPAGSVGPTSSPAVFNQIPSGYYVVIVSNDDGQADKNIFFNIYSTTPFDAGTITVAEALNCFNSSNMKLVANPVGGVAPYTYLWAQGNAAGQTSDTASGLDGIEPGYTVYVTDASGCGPYQSNAIKGFTYTVPNTINISAGATLTCEGTQNGNIIISASGGTGGLSYAINRIATSDSTAQASNSFTNLASGYYTPWAIDANGCAVSDANILVDSAAQPIAPGLTKNPADATVCISASLTVDTTAGSGGSGTVEDQFRSSPDNGGSWSAWSTSIPVVITAASGTTLIESQRTSTANGCATSASNQVSWTVVDQPTAPTLTRSPNVDSVCADQALTVAPSSGSGGTGTIADEYRYSTDNGSIWTGWGTTLPNFTAIAGTNNIESRRTATGTGCNVSPSNSVSWVVQPQPTAPTLTKSPNVAEVCALTTLTVTPSSGSGGTGTITDEYRYSTDNGNNWTAWNTSIPSFASDTLVNLIRSRRTASGSNCAISATNEVSWNVVLQPTAPGITKNPASDTVCEGTIIDINIVAGTGGAGTTEDQFRFSTNNGTSWSAWSTTFTAFASVTGTNLIQSRRTADGPGCSNSASNEVSWVVVDMPTAPGLTKNPTDATVCAGTMLTVSTTAGSGGAGIIVDEYRYSTDNGGSWSAWSTAVPNFAAIAGTNTIESRRTASGSGCTTSTSNSVSWNVVALPSAPTITKNPADATVCAGTTLTVNSVPGSGGTGTVNDEYRYSTDNGNNWTAWNTSIPSFAADTLINLVESRRSATGTGCTTSPSNQVSWNVVLQPEAPALTKNPNLDSVCEGQMLTVLPSVGTGGTGTIADEYRYSTDNGSNWTAWNTALPNFAAIAGTNTIESRRTATGTGCNVSTSNSVSWIVEAQPTAPALTKSPNVPEVCALTTLTVAPSTGSGGSGTITDEYRYSTDNGNNWTAWNTSIPSFASDTLINLIQSRRNATGASCAISATNEVSWNVVLQPTAPVIVKNPLDAIVCEGTLLDITITAGTGGAGTTEDQFRFSTNNGTNWSAWSNTFTAFAAVTGTNRIQSRRTADGPGCTNSTSNEVSWIVEDLPTAPGLTKDPIDATVCEGTTLTATTTAGSGGTGTVTDEFRHSINNGKTWTAWGTTVPNFAADTLVNIIESRRTASGLGCTTSDTNQVTWNVELIPAADAGADDDICDLNYTLAATPSIGIGTWNQISGPGTVTGWTPDQNTSNASVTVDSYGVYEFTWTEVNNICSDEDTVEITFNHPPESIAGSDASICNDLTYTIPDADTNYANSIVWVSPSASPGTFASSDLIIAPTYTPSQSERDSGSVWLYLEASNVLCPDPAIDSLLLTIAPELTASIDAPIPFPIDTNTTQIEVHLKTSGHAPNQDMSYFLVSPDGTQKVILKESPVKNTGLNFGCGIGSDIDLYFSNQRPSDDTLVICGRPDMNPIEDTVNITGFWSPIQGLNPAEGGWTIEIYDYVTIGAGFNGTVTDFYISFTDTNATTGLLESVIYNTSGASIPILDGSGYPTYGITELQAPRELEVSCFGECDAEAIVNVNGGTPPYTTFAWTPAPSISNTLGDSITFCAGTYDVTVTDAIGCQTTASVTVTEPPQVVLDTLYFTDSLQCAGDSTGTIVIKASGGRGTIQYNLLPDNVLSESPDSGLFTNLPAKTYTIEVSDGSNCGFDTTITIAQPDIIEIDTAYVSDSVYCLGDSTGRIVATAIGGTQPYSYILEPLGIVNDSGIFNKLTTDQQYFIRVTDAYSCDTVTSGKLVVGTPEVTYLDTIFSPIAACADDSVTLTVVASGGSKPYNIILLQGLQSDTLTINSDTARFLNTAPGIYDISIQNNGGCKIDSIGYIVEGPTIPLTISFTTTDVTGCSDNTNGEIQVNASNGWGNYRYSIDGGSYQASNTFSGLAKGDYTISVRDSLDNTTIGCIIDSVKTINGPILDGLLTIAVYPESGSDGAIRLSVSANNPPIRFWFSDIDSLDGVRTYTPILGSDTVFYNLGVGTYYAALKDNNGCVWEDSISLEFLKLDASIVVNNPKCNLGIDSSTVYITINDGTLPYAVLVDGISVDTLRPDTSIYNFPFLDSINIKEGVRTISIEDRYGYTFDTTVSSIIPELFFVDDINTTRKLCSGTDYDGNPTNDGSAEIITSGGVGTINFTLMTNDDNNHRSSSSLDNGTDADTAFFDTLGAYDEYIVFIQDDSACYDTQTFNIGAINVQVSGLPSDTSICKGNNFNLKAGYSYYAPAGSNFKRQVEAVWSPMEVIIDTTNNRLEPTAIAEITETTTIEVTLTQVSGDKCMMKDSFTATVLDSVGMEYLVDAENFTFVDDSNTLYIADGSTYSVTLTPDYYNTDIDTFNIYSEGDRIDPDSVSTQPPSYIWKNLIATPSEVDTVYFIGITADGCVEKRPFYIGETKEIIKDDLYNVFTPNGDGINDTWVIPGANTQPNVEVQIFNRWGQLVYNKSNYATNEEAVWDGTATKSGKDLPIGTYYYIIKPDDGNEPITGSVTILR